MHHQEELLSHLKTVLRFQNIPEIAQTILNLAEFMEHCEEAVVSVCVCVCVCTCTCVYVCVFVYVMLCVCVCVCVCVCIHVLVVAMPTCTACTAYVIF